MVPLIAGIVLSSSAVELTVVMPLGTAAETVYPALVLHFFNAGGPV
jgi:hypothetical protein